MNIQLVSIEQINPALYNPRLDLKSSNPEYARLKRSIEEFGFVEPLVWNERTGNLVGGHQRFKILLDQGRTEVECSVVDLDEQKEKALNIALNKISGDWDLLRLKDLLEELDVGDFDVELTGFDHEEIEDLMTQFFVEADPEEDDFDVNVELEGIEEAITQKGDIWLLGKHRLICGDATSAEIFQRLVKDKLVDMVFTDPPYNVDYTGKTKEALKIQNDKMNNSQFYQFLYDAFTNMIVVTKSGGGIYICHADSEGINFRTAMIDAGWELKQCIIWAKNAMVLGRQDYHWQHEPILYGWKPGASHQWHGDRKQTTLWNIDRPSRNKDHPTMKPIGIPAKAIQNSSKQGAIILDPFLGSGSTLMAAEQTNRVCYGIELDPIYCDVIVKRWEEYTNQKAVKEGGET
nr:site-specific DNA-methyltransferase [Shimazuella soli]